MALLFPLLLGLQVLCSSATSPPVVDPPVLLHSLACNDTAVDPVADLTLREINADRKEGYVLGLHRIFSVLEDPQARTGSVYYLILDVLETECHVLSRKLWKDCKNRFSHETVYGQCKATLYINKPRRIVHLYNYECTLRHVPASTIVRMCPDCPTPGCPTEPKYLETASVSLAKFNRESQQAHYFSVLSVTKASMQWVVGPSHFVEFTIQETSCSKTESNTNVSKCSPLSPELAHTGFCKGSVVNSQIEHRQFVTVSCEIYEPQAPAAEGKNQHPGSKPKRPHHHGNESSEEDQQDHRHGKKGGHHHHGKKGGHHHHHHHHHRNGQSHEQDQQPQASPSEQPKQDLPPLEKTVGWVKILPATETHVSLHTLPEGHAEPIDGQPVPPKTAESSPALPDLHGASEGGAPPQPSSPGGDLGLIRPARGPVVLPFPTWFSESDTCPGEPKVSLPIILPLLPAKPVKVTPAVVSKE